MGAVERRVSEWVDLVGDLLARPAANFPHRVISARLHETFDCQVSWNWMDPPGRAGFDLHVPMPGWPPDPMREDMIGELMHHPVMRWYMATGDLRPITIGRVPRGMITARGRRAIRHFLVPYGMEQHLALMYRVRPIEHRAYVLARCGDDFSDEDLRVAMALQPLLALLDRQISAYGVLPSPAETDLAGRELAVVQLLADGLTAASIGVRLGISSRTVHRHLQGAYRKLGTHDRVSAVLAARDAGLLSYAAEPTPRAAAYARPRSSDRAAAHAGATWE